MTAAPLRPLTPSAVVAAVAVRYDLPVVMVLGVRRSTIVAEARHVAMWLCKTLLPEHSYPDLARYFRRDHTSVMHGVGRIDALRRDDPDMRAMLDEMMRELTTGRRSPQADEVEEAAQLAGVLCQEFCRAIRWQAAADPAAFVRRAAHLFGATS